jgi:hypothetical protein
LNVGEFIDKLNEEGVLYATRWGWFVLIHA